MGYRFALDALPYGFVMIVAIHYRTQRTLSPRLRFAIVFSMLFNVYLVHPEFALLAGLVLLPLGTGLFAWLLSYDARLRAYLSIDE